MNVDGVADHRYGLTGIHHVDVHVHELRSFVAEDRGTEELVGAGVDDDLDETVFLAGFDRLAVPADVESRELDLAARLPRLGLVHSDASDLRVGEDRVRDDPVRSARAVSRHLRQQYTVIVPGRVREHGTAADVTGRPYSLNRRLQAFIDADD